MNSKAIRSRSSGLFQTLSTDAAGDNKAVVCLDSNIVWRR